MLIDVKNTLYRSLIGYAGKSINPTTAWFSTVFNMSTVIRPDAISLYWDPKSSALWRKDFYPEYKANRNNDAIMLNLNDLLKEHSINILKIAGNIGFRQLYLPNQECDDLICATCLSNKSDNLVVVSADSDLTQLYKYENISVFNPLKQIIVDKPDHDVVISKSLSGDTSDNIIGYRGIGKVTARKLALDEGKLKEFLSKVDKSIYERNRKLIDLSANEFIDTNIEYVNKIYNKPIVKLDSKGVKDIVFDLKIIGLSKLIDDNRHQINRLK